MSRQQRLQQGPTMTLYHQTDEKSARSIVTSGKFRCGSTGLAGGGIYFATSSAHTKHKAHKRGVVITCSVKLGNMKTISKKGDSSITGYKLNKQGYDSVCIPRDNGHEYVVYYTDQITIIDYTGFALHTCSKCRKPIPDHMAHGDKLCASCKAYYLKTMLRCDAQRVAMNILFR